MKNIDFSWKIYLISIRSLTLGTIGLGIMGSAFFTDKKEQLRVGKLLLVLSFYYIASWFISKTERIVSYAFRRLATFVVSIGTSVLLFYMYWNHNVYFKYSIALYYLSSLLNYAMLVFGGQTALIRPFFRIHDLLVGHVIFFILFVLSICQIGIIQTSLLYHNALSSGVEIEAVLKYARQSQEKGTTGESEIEELRTLINSQAKTIKHLLSTYKTTPTGARDELGGLLDGSSPTADLYGATDTSFS